MSPFENTTFSSEAFRHRRVLVTGAARGIGAAIGQAFSSLGAEVIGADISSGDGSVETGFPIVEVDLAQESSVNDLLPEIQSQFGSVDVLINNARSGERPEPLSDTASNFFKTMDVSLLAPMLLSQCFINNIKKLGVMDVANYSIVNISSISSSSVSDESSSYHLAKSGLEGLTRYLAVHGGEAGVRVNSVAPGFILQNRYEDRFLNKENERYRKLAEVTHPLKRIGKEDDVASAVIFLASCAARFITGEVLHINGGLNLRDGWSLAKQLDRFP